MVPVDDRPRLPGGREGTLSSLPDLTTLRIPSEVFDRHLYNKGAGVLHTLRGLMGEEPFGQAWLCI